MSEAAALTFDSTLPILTPRRSEGLSVRRKEDSVIDRLGQRIDGIVDSLKDPDSTVNKYLHENIKPRELLAKAADIAFTGSFATKPFELAGRGLHVEEAWSVSGLRRVAMAVEDKLLGEATGKTAIKRVAQMFEGKTNEEAIELIDNIATGKFEEKTTIPGLFVKNVVKTLITNRAGATARFLELEGVRDSLAANNISVQDLEQKLAKEGKGKAKLTNAEKLALVKTLSKFSKASSALVTEADLFGGIPPELARSAIKTGAVMGGLGGVFRMLGGGFAAFSSGVRTAGLLLNEQSRSSLIDGYKELQEKYGTKGALARVGASAGAAFLVNDVLQAPEVGNIAIAAVSMASSVSPESQTKFSKFAKVVAVGSGVYYLTRGAYAGTAMAGNLAGAGIHTVAVGASEVSESLADLMDIDDDNEKGTKVLITDKGDKMLFRSEGEVFGVSKTEREGFEVSKVDERAEKIGDSVKVGKGSIEYATTEEVSKTEAIEVKYEFHAGKAEKAGEEDRLFRPVAGQETQTQESGEAPEVTTDDRLDYRLNAVVEVVKNLRIDTIPNSGLAGIPREDLNDLRSFLNAHDINFDAVNWERDAAGVQNQIRETLISEDPGLSREDATQMAYLLYVMNSDNAQPTYEMLYNNADLEAVSESGVDVPTPSEYRDFSPEAGTGTELTDREVMQRQGEAIGALAHGLQGMEIPLGSELKVAGFTPEMLDLLGDYANEVADINLTLVDFSSGNEAAILAQIEGQLTDIPEEDRDDVARMVYIIYENPNTYSLLANYTQDPNLPTRSEFVEFGWTEMAGTADDQQGAFGAEAGTTEDDYIEWLRQNDQNPLVSGGSDQQYSAWQASMGGTQAPLVETETEPEAAEVTEETAPATEPEIAEVQEEIAPLPTSQPLPTETQSSATATELPLTPTPSSTATSQPSSTPEPTATGTYAPYTTPTPAPTLEPQIVGEQPIEEGGERPTWLLGVAAGGVGLSAAGLAGLGIYKWVKSRKSGGTTSSAPSAPSPVPGPVPPPSVRSTLRETPSGSADKTVVATPTEILQPIIPEARTVNDLWADIQGKYARGEDMSSLTQSQIKVVVDQFAEKVLTDKRDKLRKLGILNEEEADLLEVLDGLLEGKYKNKNITYTDILGLMLAEAGS